MEQATIKEKIEIITDHVGELIEAQKQLVITSAAIKGSEIASSVALGVIVFLFSIIFILFGAISLGFWFSSLIGSKALGFLAAGILFLLLAIICIVLKKSLINSFRDFTVKLIYDRSNHI